MSDEMLKLDELELLIREYDPEQSDWNFRRSVMMKIIDQIRPLTIRAAASAEPVADDLEDLVARFSKALLAKLKLARANGRSGWERDDWEEHCQRGLMNHVLKGDPRDVAAYCAFAWHHGWSTSAHPAPDAEIVGALTPKRLAQIRTLAKNWASIACDEEAAPTGSMLGIINELLAAIAKAKGVPLT